MDISIRADGSFNYHIKGTITGSFEGLSSGTCAYSDAGHGDESGYYATYVAVQCDGGLAGMNLQGTYAGSLTSPTTNAGTYTIKVTS